MKEELRRRLDTETLLVRAAIEARRPDAEGLRDLRAADLVHETGLPEPRLAWILTTLAADYGARVAADASGRVVFRFPARLESRRPSRLRKARRGLSLLGRNAVRIVVGLGYSFWAFLAYVLFVTERIIHAPELHGRRLGFYDLISSFIFGDRGRAGRSAEMEGRLLLSWAEGRSGIVTAEEYALYTGLGLDEAETRLAGFAAEYGGEAEALGAGRLAWRLPLPLAATRRKLSPYHPMRAFSSNPRAADLVAAILGGVNVVFGGLVIAALSVWSGLSLEERELSFALSALVNMAGLAPPSVVFALFGILPLAAGGLGLLYPLCRALGLAATNNLAGTTNARIAAGHRILEAGGFVSLPPPLRDGKGRGGLGRAGAERFAARAALDSLAAEFGARIEATADGGLVYHFDRLKELLALLEEPRRLGEAREEAGGAGIVWDSGSSEPPP
jgi:hypothetical protein